MDWAGARGLDRLLIVNQIDVADARLEVCLNELQTAFGKECLPLNLPADHATRVQDCFFAPTGGATDFSSVTTAHTKLVDQVVEVDEALMALYLEQGEALAPEQLHAPFERALREGHLIPVCFCSAETGVGIRELLEIFVRLMPNPTEANPPQFYNGVADDSIRIRFSGEASGHVLAHVFKVTIDPFLGRLSLMRIH